MKKYTVYFIFIIFYLPSFAYSTEKAPVMLAHTWDGKSEVNGWWMSEKLDGMRGYWTGKEFISRSGHIIHAPPWFTINFPTTALDGELWMAREHFQALISIVRKKNAGDEWKKVRYFIFDAPLIQDGFEKRLKYANQWFNKHPNPYTEVLKQTLCKNQAHLQQTLTDIESRGGEGIMLRKSKSPYTIGRSKDLLKVKRFQDTEARVIEHLPGKGKYAGLLGSLLVELPNGIRFSIGSGFSDQERTSPPPIGSTITFKYQGFHSSGIPRFATFLRIREKI